MIENTPILLIDDDANSSRNLATVLSFLGESMIPANSEDWAEKVTAEGLESSQFSAAIIANCQRQSLDSVMQKLYQWEAGLAFILVGDHSTSQNLDAELQTRITAQLPSTLSYQPLLDALHKAKVFREHYNRLRDFDGVRDFTMFRSLVGKSDALQKVRYMMGQVAGKEVSVLITGESGTGKEVVARNLHLNSNRSDKAFIPINCGAIPSELLESELFGHEKGAFTGAIVARAGRFELADGGTLFLDEIGDMPLSMQVKLLRVLQEQSFERVGGVNTLQSDVRILAATHKDLEKMIEQGEFRQDLYYRINVFPIEMPSLRERPEDIPLLLNELMTIMEAENRGSVRFNSAAIASLGAYPWPGNVRELANLVERMAILYPHSIVGIGDLPEKFRQESAYSSTVIDSNLNTSEASASGSVVSLEKNYPANNLANDGSGKEKMSGTLLPRNGLDLKEYLANLEKDLIEKALTDSRGVVARAADRLRLGRTTLVEKMRKYNLQKTPDNESEQIKDVDRQKQLIAGEEAEKTTALSSEQIDENKAASV